MTTESAKAWVKTLEEILLETLGEIQAQANKDRSNAKITETDAKYARASEIWRKTWKQTK